MNDLQTLPQSEAVRTRENSSRPDRPRRRDRTIDTLRGLAIFTMIAANLAAPVLAEPHPYWLRVYGSFAAPLFVVVSGMMVAYGTRRNDHTLRHYAVRGVVLVAIASLLDMLVWDNYPLLSMDVLYLLGVSLPLAYLSLRLDSRLRMLILAGILLGTPMLQQVFGYADFPREVSLARGSRAALAPTDFIHHWFIDGWFPLFPWLGFAIFGVQLTEFRSPRLTVAVRRASPTPLCVGLALLAIGIAVCYMLRDTLLVRAGYSELFYPPTPGFVVAAVGMAVTLLAAIDWKPDLGVYRPLQILGESALTIYLVHLVLIDYVIARNVTNVPLPGFAVLYAGMIAAMLALARAEQVLKSRWGSPVFRAGASY